MLRIALFLCSLAFAFTSCECVVKPPCADKFAFKLLDGSTGRDLVFDSPFVYNRDSVYLFTTIPGYTGPSSRVDSAKFASILAFATDTLLLHLNAQEVDTLFLTYHRVKRMCCNEFGGYGNLQSVAYHQRFATKDGDTYILRK
jgi:hypothetical protein